MNVLLPASGFGKRNSGPLAKELIVKRGFQNELRPLIEFSFLHLLEPSAKGLVKKIVIITRKEKVEALNVWLNKFRSQNSFSIEVQITLHEPRLKEEWPLSLLAAEPLWGEKNLVLLPDTQLMLRQGLVKTFDEKLEKFLTVWGILPREISEVRSFGMVERGNSSSDPFSITEKPLNPTSPWVWGCFAFQKNRGRALLTCLEESTQTHQSFTVPTPSTFVELDSFEDLSR
jgi:dTDP-glucose pyrophosphorylase